MRLRLAFAAGSLFVLVFGSAAEAVGGGSPPVALSVSPARVAFVAPASRTIALRNVGTERVVVDVAPKSLDRPAAAKRWLRVRPARLVLRASSQALVTLRAGTNRLARPGDHQLRVLLVARPAGGGRIGVRIRLAVGVRVRMPGRTIRSVALRGVRVRRHGPTRDLLVSVANRGNITEQLGGRLTVTLTRAGRVVSRLRLRRPRELFPGAQAAVPMRYVGLLRGPVTALVTVRPGGRLRAVERRYRIRL